MQDSQRNNSQSDPRNSFDDARLTAFVLNELDENERAAMEAALAKSPALRDEVDALRRTATLLRANLEHEAIAPSSSAVQKTDAYGLNSARGGVRPRSSRVLRFGLYATAVAACVGLAWVFTTPLRHSDRGALASHLAEHSTGINVGTAPSPTGAAVGFDVLGKQAQPASSPMFAVNSATLSPATTANVARGAGAVAALGYAGQSSDLHYRYAVAQLRDELAYKRGVTSEFVAQQLAERSSFGIGVNAPGTRLRVDVPALGQARVPWSQDVLRIARYGADSGTTAPDRAGRASPKSEGALLEQLWSEAPIDGFSDGDMASSDPSDVAARIERRRALLDDARIDMLEQLFATGAEFHQHMRYGEAAYSMQQALLLDPQNAAALNNFELYDELAWLQSQQEAYAQFSDNPFMESGTHPLSTFSIDVDTASYSNVRRFIESGSLPPRDAVRIEELINYFSYDDAPPTDGRPFAANIEIAACPWTPAHRLVRVGIKGKTVETHERGAASLVFLIDVSGSMQAPNRLPLVIESLKLLVSQLRADDRVALAVYAGASGLVLPSTPAGNADEIVAALDRLRAGGSTNGAAGIQLAYDTATQNFIAGGVNRVILCTDGDFNVGITDRDELVRMIEEKAKSGVFLSTLGYGMGNLKDATLEQLADKGNGNYAYIDTLKEARKVLVEQMNGTLITIAKDVKIQVEFNPALVAGYRLIGYENRTLAARDFNDDTKDAGEIGAGHSVTALYEVVPAGSALPVIADFDVLPAFSHLRELDAYGRAIEPAAAGADRADDAPPVSAVDAANARRQEQDVVANVVADPSVDPLKYATPTGLVDAATGNAVEMLTLKLRYKEPDGDTSTKIEFAASDSGAAFADASADLRFASSVAAYGMLLRQSPFVGAWGFRTVVETATQAVGADANGYRSEFIGLATKAGELSAR